MFDVNNNAHNFADVDVVTVCIFQICVQYAILLLKTKFSKKVLTSLHCRKNKTLLNFSQGKSTNITKQIKYY